MENKNILQSADNALAILELFSDHEELGVSEVGTLMGIGKSTAFRLLSTLVNRKFLIKLSNNRYRLGLRLFSFGQLIKERLSIRDLVNPHLVELSKCSGETAHLVVWYDDFHVIFVDKVLSSSVIRMDSYIGFVLPAHLTGSGKALLSTLTDEKIDRYIQQTDFIAKTSNSIVNRDTLLKEIEEIRKCGYSLDNEESEVGLFCTAAPVIDTFKIAQGAISISGPTSRMKTHLDENIKFLLKTAAAVSSEL